MFNNPVLKLEIFMDAAFQFFELCRECHLQWQFFYKKLDSEDARQCIREKEN